MLEVTFDCTYNMVGPQKQWWRQASVHSNVRMPSRHCGRANIKDIISFPKNMIPMYRQLHNLTIIII